MKIKKIGKVLLSVVFISLLASCNEDIINYPSNQDSTIAEIGGDNDGNVTNNTYADVYKQITSSGSPAASTLDNLLYSMASNQYLKDDFAISDAQLAKRYQKSMLDSAKGGSYSTDNYFDEYRYALSLINSGYTIKTSTGASDLASIKAAAHTPAIINPDLKKSDQSETTQAEKWDEVFDLDYTDYINRYYKPTIYRQYLTAYYIYNNSYSTIGNTSARDVTIVKITDRTDKPGEAIKLINAWVKDKMSTNTDLHNLARLWKGIDVSAEEQNWLDTNNISNLSSKIDEEINKVVDGFTGVNTNWANVTSKSSYLTDSSLESSYTGSYAYPVEHGYDLARRSLEVSDLITEGTFLNSSTVGDVPSALKSSIFSSNISTDVDSIYNGTKKDVTYVYKDANNEYVRYIAPSTSMTGTNDLVNSIVTYDSTSKSYFIVQLNKVVTTSRIVQSESDDEATKDYKRQLAMDTAYEMASSETYKKTAIVWFLTNNTISYSDPDFYSYINTNYPDAIDD